MTAAKRPSTSDAVAGLFAKQSATGGLAGRDGSPPIPRSGRRAPAGERTATTRVRVGVELTEEQSGYLRSLSRPDRTHGPRTLGTKFVATGVLVAAIELIRAVDVDMHGVAAGDEDDMAARARAALLRATANHDEEEEGA